VKPAVSVVIVNLNRRDLLENCLRSLWAQTFTDFEVIVVDNGSSDGSVVYLKSIRNSKLKIVPLTANRGFAGGCNAGIAVAEGAFIATLNNDAEADPRWLEELVRTIESRADIGMVASKILFHGDRDRIDKVGHLIYLDGLNHGRGSGEPDRGQYEKCEEVLFPDGAAALYRRLMLDQVGVFDETFFAYGDDADLGLRGRLAGWTCLYAPRAIVFHIHSATAGEFSPLKAFLIERNRIFVMVKLFPVILLAASPFLTGMRLLFHAYGALFAVGSSGRYASDASRLGLVTAILKAYWSGLKHLPEMWHSRRKVRRFVRVSDMAFLALLWRHRITLRALTLGT
jgi:GT2 family glycosyltransferase